MELFKNIRLRFGTAIMEKKAVRTKKEIYYSNFDQVKSIGIVWDASKPGELSGLSRFYQKMHEKNIEVKIFGYYPGKIIPVQYSTISYLTCIGKNQINFLYFPISSEANTFINKPFDILIDLNFEKQFTLRYITNLSTARFKAGLFDHEKPDTPFDLMIDIKKPVDIDDYFYQLIHYLEMVKDETVKKTENN